jgi:hypothetical protein
MVTPLETCGRYLETNSASKYASTKSRSEVAVLYDLPDFIEVVVHAACIYRNA